MSGALQAQALCPRCYAQLSPGSTRCGRCGTAVEGGLPGQRLAKASGRNGAYCPRCDRLETDGARFAGAVGTGPSGSCPHCGTALVEAAADDRVAYEEVSVGTDSWDLDRLTRAEAVDGWTLVDTTVDPTAPDRLLAHFRRALPADDPRTRQILGGDTATAQTPLPAAAPGHAAQAAATPQAKGKAASPTAAPATTAPATAAPAMDRRARVRAERAARRQTWDARRAARRARRDGLRPDWLPQAVSGEFAAVVVAMVGLALTIAVTAIRLVVIPIMLALASVGRELFLSFLHAFLGPGQRRGHRRTGWHGRW